MPQSDRPLPTVHALAADLAAGRTRSQALVEAALDRIDDPSGEGARTFIRVDREGALAAARASDDLRARGVVASPLAGLPVAVKDLFDIAGQITSAGSRILADAPPAIADAPAVARLRAAGAILIGRTNMTEFAYSGLGINPHYGTPGNPADRTRVPGGSSSGAGVAVADRMAVAALGSDTGGSVRIPSALCGVTGFKPTQERVSCAGAVPLSTTLDSIGPLAPSIACCATLDAILSGGVDEPLPAAPELASLRFAVPRTLVLDELDDKVAAAFARALSRLSAAGARIAEIDVPPFAEQAALNAAGGFSAPEALDWHRALMARDPGAYDPRVLDRIERGRSVSAADYVGLLRARARLIAALADLTRPYDALLFPTVAIVAPTFAAVAEDAGFHRLNRLVLRNPSLVNFLDRCAASLPIAAPGELPVGLMLMGEHGADRQLLAVASRVEAALAA